MCVGSSSRDVHVSDNPVATAHKKLTIEELVINVRQVSDSHSNNLKPTVEQLRTQLGLDYTAPWRPRFQLIKPSLALDFDALHRDGIWLISDVTRLPSCSPIRVKRCRGCVWEWLEEGAQAIAAARPINTFSLVCLSTVFYSLSSLSLTQSVGRATANQLTFIPTAIAAAAAAAAVSQLSICSPRY
jgi:hypothetical protein